MEVEILEKKCQNLQESSRQHFAELNTLRLQYHALQEEYSLLQTHISQRELEARIASSCVQELKDSMKEREVSILGKDSQIQAMAHHPLIGPNNCSAAGNRFQDRWVNTLVKSRRNEIRSFKSLSAPACSFHLFWVNFNSKGVIFSSENGYPFP